MLRIFKIILVIFMIPAFSQGCISADGPAFDPLFNYPGHYTTVYLYRPPYSRNSGVTPVIHINNERVVSMQNGGFTRIFLRPGTYTIAIERNHRLVSSDVAYEFSVPEQTKNMFVRIATSDNLAGDLVVLATVVAVDVAVNTLMKTNTYASPGFAATRAEFGLNFIQEEHALKEIRECKYLDPEAFNLLAVLSVDVQGVDEISAAIPLTESVRAEIGESGKYEVLPAYTTDILLKEQAFRQSDMTLADRAVKAGKMLGAGKVVVCFVATTDTSYIATLALINVSTGKVEAMKDIVCRRDSDELIATGRMAALELIGRAGPPQEKPDIVDAPVISTITITGVYNDPVTGMEFVPVKGGCYRMGEAAKKAGDFERTAHDVCVDDYYMAKHEVTQGQWRMIMGNNPAEAKKGDSYPVENISWEDVRTFILNLRQKTGMPYRLPTEAEWEYAARSGGRDERWAGTNDEALVKEYAWYRIVAMNGSRPQPVGLKKPNGLGLYDMSGNVKEWVNDIYGDNYYRQSPKHNPQGPDTGDRRVLRGGSWDNKQNGVTVMDRDSDTPASSFNDYGFRLAVQ